VYTGPALRDPTTNNVVNFDGTESNEHYTVTAVHYSYHIANTNPGRRDVTFKPPTAGPDHTYYLPFKQKNISSIILGNAADTFFTDNLSGCSIFIDRAANGNLIVYHANQQGGEYMPTPEQAQNYTFERGITHVAKLVQHQTAQASTLAYAGAVNVASLHKSRYMEAAARQAETLRNARLPIPPYGTTVVGFFRGGSWRFWYQTWLVAPTNACIVVRAEQFYP
jgi:hypothetical protein